MQFRDRILSSEIQTNINFEVTTTLLFKIHIFWDVNMTALRIIKVRRCNFVWSLINTGYKFSSVDVWRGEWQYGTAHFPVL
jgi:hypothetical protein